MKSIPCNIVILPSETLAQRAVNISEQLRPNGVLFTLQAGVCFPHASLYMTQLKVSDLDRAGRALAEVAERFTALDLEATHYHQEQGFIDIEFARSQALDDLQAAVVQAINPIRDGMREKDKARMVNATGLAKENFEKYGYPNIGKLFRPHITLTRFIDSTPKNGLKLPPVSEFNGLFAKIGLFEMGDNGTCVRQLAEFEFTINAK